jgi:hypothetical protein
VSFSYIQTKLILLSSNINFVWFPATSFLSHSDSEFWFSEDIFNLDFLKKQVHTSNPILPYNCKTSHPESNLLRTLSFLLKIPINRVLREWAKTVALSIQTISDENPKAPQIASGATSMKRHVLVLQWLNTLKNTMPTLPQLTEGPSNTVEEIEATNTSTAPPGDALDDFRKVIIEMMMSYTIIEAHSQDQYNPRKKSKNNEGTSRAVSKKTPNHQSLQKIESRHNYLPFLLYLLGGVRGIFNASRDHRQYAICDILEVLHIFREIQLTSPTEFKSSEEVWVNLGTYIRQILSSVIQSPEDVSKFIIPTRHELAKRIAHDYINHTSQESDLFNIPQPRSLQ